MSTSNADLLLLPINSNQFSCHFPRLLNGNVNLFRLLAQIGVLRTYNESRVSGRLFMYLDEITAVDGQ